MSNTGLTNISVSELAVQNTILAGDELDSGTLGQVLISGGSTGNVRWGSNSASLPNALTMGSNVFLTSGNSSFDGSIADTINSIDTDTTYTAGNGIQISGSNIIQTKTDNQTIRDSGGGSGNNLEVIKVPNDLTFTGYATGTFNGSSALNINLVDTDTTYTAGFGIAFSGTQINANPDNTTIDYNGAGYTLRVLKVPNTLTCGANLAFITGTDYDGSAARQITLTKTPTGFNSITMSSTPSATTITGNTYPSNPTQCSYLDLTSSTNLIAGGVLATKIQRTTLFKSFSTAYSEFSSNFRTSFVAISPNVMVEFRAIVRCDNRLFYGGLYDYVNLVYQGDTRTRFNYNDETDQDFTTLTWWMTGLTPGNTYYISPYFRGDINYVYMYVGHGGAVDGYAPAIMRIYDGGNNVNIY